MFIVVISITLFSDPTPHTLYVGPGMPYEACEAVSNQINIPLIFPHARSLQAHCETKEAVANRMGSEK
jgi:hypothetical protein